MFRARALDQEQGSLLSRAYQILQRGNRDKNPPRLAVLDNSHYVPFVAQQIVGAPHFQVLGLGLPVIHQHVVWSLQITALQENKTVRYITKLRWIDSPNRLNSSRGVELEQRGCNRLHIL